MKRHAVCRSERAKLIPKKGLVGGWEGRGVAGLTINQSKCIRADRERQPSGC